MQNIVIVGASNAGHTIAAGLGPKLPKTHRIVIIDPAPTSYWPISSLRAAVQPGWESKVYHKLEQKNLFPANSKNVLVRSKVSKLDASSVVLDQEFEGSNVVPFAVSLGSSTMRLYGDRSLHRLIVMWTST
jgi:NADH dehydrogenase FAD-containing subunit